ncbi:16537_t:CDS:2 [Gigaspora margarita]|uniref:16537_t:CDS:1 n=1 Tax=Gigaspora margarita TaxID=4874 RepID=A0ABN7V3F8_GIGMA|nr:16537_t:CDS:2 [Gigaspora margarita]
MYNISTDKSFKETLRSSIISEKQIVTDQTKRLEKLKRHAEAQARLIEKKAKLLEEGIVEKYDGPGRPLAAMIDPDLWNKIYECVEFGKMKPHVNEHYCLASVKSARTFAKVFADDAVIISQDDKAKIVADHDFPVGSKMKLIPSVYLIIDPANSNNSLRLGQLSIFVRPEYFVGTSSLTHISDLQSIITNQQFAGALIKEDKIKPIFVLLSAYNPVERSMASLSEKLAGITLPIDNFGLHLDSQGKVLDEDLYVDQMRQPFAELESTSEYRAPDTALLLDQNNGFLPPIMKAKDQHYINPIHALQYCDKLKILPYDRCCPSISCEHSSNSSNSSNYGCSPRHSIVFNTEDVLQSNPQVVIE